MNDEEPIILPGCLIVAVAWLFGVLMAVGFLTATGAL